MMPAAVKGSGHLPCGSEQREGSVHCEHPLWQQSVDSCANLSCKSVILFMITSWSFCQKPCPLLKVTSSVILHALMLRASWALWRIARFADPQSPGSLPFPAHQESLDTRLADDVIHPYCSKGSRRQISVAVNVIQGCKTSDVTPYVLFGTNVFTLTCLPH